MTRKISNKEASEVVKRYAKDQKIAVRLSEEQLDAILKQWTDMDPNKPAEITFYVDEVPRAGLKVASYSYSGDTCCA